MMTRGAAAAVVGSRGAHHVKRGSAVGIAEARDAPAGPIFEQLRGAGRSGGAGSAVESRRARDGAASSRGKVGEGCVRQWGRGRARTSAAARTWSASNSATAAMNALVCSMAFMTFSFRASSRALMVAALVALDRQCGSTEKAAAQAAVEFRGRNLGPLLLRLSRSRQLIQGPRHTEARDCTAVARVDPPTTVDVRRSLQSPRRRRRGAAHSPSPSRLPREGASTARSDVSRDRDRSQRMLFHFQTPATIT